jgi:hypothetical protein
MASWMSNGAPAWRSRLASTTNSHYKRGHQSQEKPCEINGYVRPRWIPAVRTTTDIFLLWAKGFLIEQGFQKAPNDKGSLQTALSMPKLTRCAGVRTVRWTDLQHDHCPLSGAHPTRRSIADRDGISERVSDAITGHSPQTQGRRYGQPTLDDMAEALKRFPRY